MVGCFYVEAVVSSLDKGSGFWIWQFGRTRPKSKLGRKEETPKQFRLKASRGQQHAVSIVDLDTDPCQRPTTSPCRANQYPDGRDPDVFVD